MRYLSFFSGALGLDLGLEQAGWSCLAANEFDAAACATARANRPRLSVLEGDVREISASWLKAKFGKVDAIVGGPPCQAFSTAGRRLGLSDERGNVFLHFLDLACAVSPETIVIENVRGLLSAKALADTFESDRGLALPPDCSGSALSLVLARLRRHGYRVSFNLYDAANFGVPQRRERVVLLATKSRQLPHMPPTHSAHEWVSFGDAVKGLSDPGPTMKLRPAQREFLPLVPEGGNWRNLDPDLHRRALGGAFEAGGGRVGFLRRLAWAAPSPTLVTCPTMPATLLGHPEDDRALGLNEYKRIQTFPDDWVTCGTLAEQFKQIGNAVPVNFARQMGLHIMGASATRPVASTSRYRQTCERSWAAKYQPSLA